jgi:aspartyl protease family protein
MYRIPLFMLLGVVAMFGVAHLVFAYAVPSSEDAPAAAAAPATEQIANGDETVIRRDASGQFFLDVHANGQDSKFLIDTGADFVALTVAEADSLGIDFDPANFEPITKTASGIGMGQRVTIEKMTINNQDFDNVEAIVIEGLETNLLGQSILSRLGQIEMRGDEMVIRHVA